MSIDAMGEAYYGADRGFFHDNGVNAAVTTLSNSSAIVQSVLAGDLDAGMTNTVQLAVAVARNVPVQMIAPASLYSTRDNTQGLAVAKNAPFTSAKDLIGATIAVSALADFNQLGISAWLDRNGVSPSSVHFVELRFSEMGQALARGTVQAAQIAEPSMSAAIHAGDVRPFATCTARSRPNSPPSSGSRAKPGCKTTPTRSRNCATASSPPRAGRTATIPTRPRSSRKSRKSTSRP